MDHRRGVHHHRSHAQEVDAMTQDVLVARVVPPLRKKWRGRYLLERNVLATKSFWPVLVSGFFEPIFYLFAIGIGIGQLAGDVEFAGVPVEYTAFVAPAMLAASAMNGAIFESTNIFFKLKYGKIYDGVLATPVEPVDVASGEIGWTLARGAMYSAAFLLVMAVMGLIESPLGILAFPAAILIGFAFGAVATAGVTWMRTWQDLDFVGFISLPLFLFSATFYPLDVYPPFLQVVAWFSPLYHGVVLVRGLTLGILSWTMLINIAYLLALGIIGSVVTARRIGSMLRV
jgi:lipooligosaccharide transport system permease protein